MGFPSEIYDTINDIYKRGLYVISDGTKINADVNGAYNIMRKVSRTSVRKNCLVGFWRTQYG